MPYFHVLVSTEPDTSKLRCIFRDLADSSLKSNFLKPYHRGNSIMAGGEVIPLSNIRRVVISATDLASDATLRTLNDTAQQSWTELGRGQHGLVVIGPFLGYGYDDLASLGKNVTSSFITEAPAQSEKPPLPTVLLSNQWLIAVGGAVIAGGILAWLKWN